MNDNIIRATAAQFPFRFVLVNLTRTANHIGQIHQARGQALSLLAEVSMSSLLLASGLKFPGTVSLSFEVDGDLSFINADSTPTGLVRAMIPQEEIQSVKNFEMLLSPQKMRVRRINEKGKIVQESIVDAVSTQMGPNLAAYLMQSDQLRSAVGVFTKLNPENDKELLHAVAFMAEAFPNATESDLEKLDANVRALENMDAYFSKHGVSLPNLLDKIAGDMETEILREIAPQHFCPCSKIRTLDTLGTIPSEDLLELLKEEQDLDISCDYCRTNYVITPTEIRNILNQRNT